MCRPPPKPPDRQNSLNDKASKRVFHEIHYANEERVNYRLPPKLPFILNAKGEVIGIIEKENLPYVVPKPRPLPKPPRIHGNGYREGIRDPEKEQLLGTEPNYIPHPKPPKSLWHSQGTTDNVNVTWNTIIYYIWQRKFSASSCGKILAPSAYIKVVAVTFSYVSFVWKSKKKNNFELSKTVI